MKNKQQLIFGLHAVEALLNNNPQRIIQLSIDQERHDKKIEAIIKLGTKLEISMEFLAKKTLDKLTQAAHHQGVVAYCMQGQVYGEQDLKLLLNNLNQPPFLLILDGVQDPHNLGACFRSADAAGVHAIIAPKDKAVGITPVVTKVASGAAETVPFIQVTNLARTLGQLKELGIWIYGADAEAKQTLCQTDLSGPIALVLGAEGKGLRRLTRESCDVLLKIPMQGTVSSLNVSVAAGVFLFEVVRQRESTSS